MNNCVSFGIFWSIIFQQPPTWGDLRTFGWSFQSHSSKMWLPSWHVDAASAGKVVFGFPGGDYQGGQTWVEDEWESTSFCFCLKSTLNVCSVTFVSLSPLCSPITLISMWPEHYEWVFTAPVHRRGVLIRSISMGLNHYFYILGDSAGGLFAWQIRYLTNFLTDNICQPWE